MSLSFFIQSYIKYDNQNKLESGVQGQNSNHTQEGSIKILSLSFFTQSYIKYDHQNKLETGVQGQNSKHTLEGGIKNIT